MDDSLHSGLFFLVGGGRKRERGGGKGSGEREIRYGIRTTTAWTRN